MESRVFITFHNPAEVDGGHQPPLESELPALDERASVPAAQTKSGTRGLQGERRKCEKVVAAVAGRERRVTLLRGRFPGLEDVGR